MAKQIKPAKAARKIDKKVGNDGQQLMLRWLCNKAGCPYQTNYCWQPRLEEADDNSAYEEVQIYPGRYSTYEDGGVD